MHISISPIFKLSPLHPQQGALGDWPHQAGCLPTDLPFTPSVSTMITRNLAASPEDPPDSWPSRESTAYAGGDEREGDGADRKQKKKKKRRQKDEGSYEHIENRGYCEVQVEGENAAQADDFYHRIGPRREKGDSGWEEHLGKSGGKAKRSKSRKKLPEEWGVMAEPFVPPAATSHVTDEVMIDTESSTQETLEASFADMDTSQSPWKTEVYPESKLVPASVSQDLPPTAVPISPLVLNSELKATAAPFTMPSTNSSAMLDDPFDHLVDNKHDSTQAFSPPFSPEIEPMGGDMVDSGIFDNISTLQQSCVQGLSEGDTLAFSPASQPSPAFSPTGEVVASAPPLSPSEDSWLLNESHISSTEVFDFSTMGTPGPLPLGLCFDTPSPAPLRSPKTTAQEFQAKEHKDAKASQKQSKKSRSSSSSSPIKSPTSPGAKTFSPQASPVISPSSPPSGTPLGVPGSGLNPAAKPFFPSFADPMEETVPAPPVAPINEGWLQSTLDK